MARYWSAVFPALFCNTHVHYFWSNKMWLIPHQRSNAPWSVIILFWLHSWYYQQTCSSLDYLMHYMYSWNLGLHTLCVSCMLFWPFFHFFRSEYYIENVEHVMIKLSTSHVDFNPSLLWTVKRPSTKHRYFYLHFWMLLIWFLYTNTLIKILKVIIVPEDCLNIIRHYFYSQKKANKIMKRHLDDIKDFYKYD